MGFCKSSLAFRRGSVGVDIGGLEFMEPDDFRSND